LSGVVATAMAGVEIVVVVVVVWARTGCDRAAVPMRAAISIVLLVCMTQTPVDGVC
jgi:hypothetical protein